MTEEQEKRQTLLIVDDTPSNISLLEEIFSKEYSIRSTTRGSEALMIAREIPDLILLDIMMPEMNGYEVCEKLKESPALRDIPVIFLSSLSSAVIKAKALKSGGVDYISKPFHLEEIRTKVKTLLMTRKLQLSVCG
ncbi:MAG: response regulator [Pelobacteraceae bacterium]